MKPEKEPEKQDTGRDALLLRLFVRKRNELDRVLFAFRKLTGERLSLDDAAQFQQDHADGIAEGIEKSRTDISRMKLGSQKRILKMLEAELDYALREDVARGTRKNGRDSYEDVHGRDTASVFRALSEANKIVSDVESRKFTDRKVSLKEKCGPGRSGHGMSVDESEAAMHAEKEDEDVGFTDDDTAGINFA